MSEIRKEQQECVRHSDQQRCQDLSLAQQSELQNDSKEMEHIQKVCESFRQYATFSRTARVSQQMRVRAYPESQRRFLPLSMQPGTPEAIERENKMKHAELRNQFFLDMSLRHAGMPHSQDTLQNGSEKAWASDDDMSKVQSVFKSLARDWSNEGKIERQQSYDPVINGFAKHLPIDGHDSKHPPRLVVPGAGVGRLALELAKSGYGVQGNEFSFQMLLASDFILNGGCRPKQAFDLYPYLSETCNLHSYMDLVTPVMVPDCDPFDILLASTDGGDEEQKMPDFSMAAGEFNSIYRNEQELGQWDGVASCFFLDTAPVVVEYLQTIHGMLRDGGLLVNFGPLLFHFNCAPMRPGETPECYRSRLSHLDQRYLDSIDMTYDDIKEVLHKVGFEILEESTGHTAYYTANPRSMKKTEYSCVYFVAKKRGK